MKTDLRQIIARNVKRYREKAGLTQEQLAIRIREIARDGGRTIGTITTIEQGRVMPKGDTLKWIADALGVTVDDLMKK